MASRNPKSNSLGILVVLAAVIGLTFFAAMGNKSSSSERSSSKPQVNGKSLVCGVDFYNCPSYRGNKRVGRLTSCKDVRLVFKSCRGDVHGLDADNDGYACDVDCGDDTKNQRLAF